MALSSPFALTPKPLVVVTRAGRWFPVAVTLSNTGEAVTGEVRLRLTSGSGFDVAPNDFYSPVDLPSNSRKVVWLYGRVERPLISGFEVTFSGRGFAPITLRGDINSAEEDQSVVLTVADSDDGLANTLKSLRGQALFRSGTSSSAPRLNPNAQPVRPLQLNRESVPDRWFGLECADMVVLGDFPHASLSPSQIEALRGYVQGGGTLTVVGGGNTARLATSPLKDLWPIQPKNSGVASAGEVQALVRRYVPVARNGADRLGGAPVQVVRGTLDADAILKGGSAAAPLFALRDNGAGRCLFLSYNPAEPPFQGWSGQGELWSDVLKSVAPVRRLEGVDSDFMNSGSGVTPGYNSSYNGSFNNGGYNSYNPYEQNGPSTATGQLLQAVQRAPQLRMPPVSQIAWFLALYVFFLVPVNYAVLRLLDRREMAWITIPAIVAIFSFWAYSAALSIRGKAILTRQVDVVQASMGATRGRDDSLLWLFSPRRTSYDLVSSGQSAAVSDFANQSGTNQGTFSVLQPGDGGSFKAESAGVWMWTDRAFSAQALAPLGKGVQLVGNAVRNGTPYELEGATWVQDGRVWPLGSIQRGGSASITGQGEKLGADMAGGIGRAGHLASVFDAATNSNSIPSQTLAAIFGPNLGKLNEGAMLIAWGKTPLAALDVNGAKSSNVTMFLFRANKLPARLAAREAVVSRVAFEPFQAIPPQSNSNYGAPAPAVGGYALYDCTLPAQGTMTLQARGTGLIEARPGSKRAPSSYAYGRAPSTLQFEGLDARTSTWRPLQGRLRSDKSPQGGWNYEATLDRAWTRQPDSVLRVRARLSSQQVQISSLNVGIVSPANG